MSLLRPCNVLVDSTLLPLTPTARRSLGKRIVDKLDRLCSPSTRSTRSSSSTESCDGEIRDSTLTVPSPQARVDSLHLGPEIEAVRVEHSIRKHDHRYYIIYVYRKSTRVPIYRRDPDYEIEVPYAAFFSLQDKILESGERNKTHCVCCASRVEILLEQHENVHAFSRILRSTEAKEEWLERFLHSLLGIFVDTAEPSSIVGPCDGCESTSNALALFLKRQYQRTTGLI